MIFRPLLEALDKWTRPQAHTPTDGLIYWQERMVLCILLTGIIFGLLAYIPSVRLCIKEGRWLVVFFDTAVYAMAVVLFFVRQIPFAVRAYAVIMATYILGMVLMTIIGPAASGPVWLFAFPVIAGIILGLRAAFIALGLNVLSLIIVGIMIGQGTVPGVEPMPHTMERWVVISLNFIMLNALAVLALAIVLRGLESLLNHEKAMRESLQEQMNVRMQAEEARRITEEKFRHLFENAPVGIFRTTAAGKVLDVNPEMARIVGFDSPEETVAYYANMAEQLYVDPERRAEFVRIMKKHGQVDNFEYQAYRRDGKKIWIAMNARIDKQLHGDEFIIEGFAVEITRRKQYEQELTEYRMAVESSQEFMAVVDDNYTFRMVNAAYVDLIGFSRDQIIGYRIEKILGAEFFQNIIKSYIDQCLAGTTVKYEIQRYSPKFGELYMAVTYYPLRAEGRIKGVVGILRDVTDYKAAESELIESREQLRHLSAHLEEVREKERIEIAQMLHDEVGQALMGLRIDTLQLEKILRDAKPELVQSTRAMLELIDYLNNRTKQLVSDLRPGILDDLGLIMALEWYVDNFMQRTGIQCIFSPNIQEQELADEIATGIYRICQEALTNVYRHAAASMVRVALTVANDQISVEIWDDGIGIARQSVNHPKSFGLMGMRERARTLGGIVTVERGQPAGTTVRVQVPIKSRAQAGSETR